MEGDPNKYAPYRKKICEFIEKNRLDYEPFIEDDETFEGVCNFISFSSLKSTTANQKKKKNQRIKRHQERNEKDSRETQKKIENRQRKQQNTKLIFVVRKRNENRWYMGRSNGNSSS